MATATDTAFRVARPTLNVDGEDKPDLASGLLDLLVVENTSGLYRCEAHFGNWGTVNGQIDFMYFDRKTLEFGKSFQVKLGTEKIFDGKITALEANFPQGAPPELNVLAEDRFQELRMTRRTRTFSDVSDSDVMSQIASDHGLSPSIDATGPQYKVLAQVNQSDLAFLRDRARAIDAELWMDGTTLNVKSRSNRNGTPFEMTHGAALREFSVLADLAGQRTSVTVSGWDVSGKSELSHEATESVISGELNGDSSGASVLSSALGSRKEALVHTVPLSSSEAQAQAESYFKMTARRFVAGHGVAEADASIRVGSHLKLEGLGPLFSGKYYVTEVRHMFDGSGGMRTEFKAERPGLGKAQ